jgi:hypothetical protein
MLEVTLMYFACYYHCTVYCMQNEASLTMDLHCD